jgi:iron complex transport system permease protein
LKELDLLSQGEPTARSMGVHVGWLKARVLFWVSLLTATAVSSSGVIGFVGLIVPHVTRMFVGPNHRRMAPVVFVAGGTFLLLADVFSRWVIQPAEVRIGIITALMGVPFFLYLLRRRSLGWSDQP